MERSKLPIGIQTFRKIREEEHYYEDKTAFARELLAQGDHFFFLVHVDSVKVSF